MRALLLDAGDGQAAAAAARSLAEAGWTVGLGAPRRGGLRTSRTIRATHAVPWPATGVDAALRAVEAAVADRGYDVVLPCGDDWVALLDRETTVPWQVAGTVGGAPRRCLDKVELARAAAAVGLRSPRTVPLDEASAAAWEGPAVVKARSHWLPDHDDPRERLEARFVRSATEALDFAADAAAAGGGAVLQEPVAGSLGAVVGLVQGGRFVRVAQQRADLVWPQPAGITARAETVAPDASLVERTGELADDLGYEGLVQVEFLHPRDGGEPLVIDCNPRCYGSLALAEAAGLGLVPAWGRWVATDEVPRPRAARVGVRYVWTEGAVRAALAADEGERPSAVGLVRDLATATHPTWRGRDPLPGLLQWVRLGLRVLRRGTRGGA